MLVKDILLKRKHSFSFEFFPPKTSKGWEKLFLTISELKKLQPAYVSVTYGAGGSTRDNTHKLINRIQNETNINVVSHLTVVNSSQDEIYKILSQYKEQNILNILALRGDPPKNSSVSGIPYGDFKYAKDLVKFIKKHFPEMSIGVAGFPEGHPQTPNRLKEMDYLKEKVDSGSDYIVTQLFFNNHDFYDFCERCELAGIHVPIIAGIMPITSKQTLFRMSELSGGTRFPAKLLKAIFRMENNDDVEKMGIHWATEQVSDLISQNTKGIHFYTLNTARATTKIYHKLSLSGLT